MFITKNIFVFLLSMIALCLLIILFNFLAMNDTVNLVLSSIIFGTFITFYFKELKLCMILFSLFFFAMLLLSQSLDVILMFLSAVAAYFFITTTWPKLKNIQFKPISRLIRMD